MPVFQISNPPNFKPSFSHFSQLFFLLECNWVQRSTLPKSVTHTLAADHFFEGCPALCCRTPRFQTLWQWIVLCVASCWKAKSLQTQWQTLGVLFFRAALDVAEKSDDFRLCGKRLELFFVSLAGGASCCDARFASPIFVSAATFAWLRCVEAAWVRCYFSFWRAVCWNVQRFQTQRHVKLVVHFFEGCESKLFDKEWFFCIAIRRGSRAVNILQVEPATLLVLQAPALLEPPHNDTSKFYGDLWGKCQRQGSTTL